MLELEFINLKIIFLIVLLFSCENRNAKDRTEKDSVFSQNSYVPVKEEIESSINKGAIDSCLLFKKEFHKVPDTYIDIIKQYRVKNEELYDKSGAFTYNELPEFYTFFYNFNNLTKCNNIDEEMLNKCLNIVFTTTKDSLLKLENAVVVFKENILIPVSLNNVKRLVKVLKNYNQKEIYEFWYYYFYAMHPSNYYFSDKEHKIDSVKIYDIDIYKIQQTAYKKTIIDCESETLD